jgi:exonuclease III
MNCLGWNCRGGGNAATIRELGVLIQTHVPKMVFLCETRQKSNRMERLKRRFGLGGYVGCDSDGLSGGLALYWHESMQVDVKEVTSRYIDVHVRESISGPLWHATFVYGEPRVDQRHIMWSALCALRATSDLPWFLVGDFNEALWQHEHFSICPRPESQMSAFRDAVLLCELKDLGFSGLPFTYDNRRSGRANVKVRLDRALADDRWRDIFTDVSVVHLVSPCSDHCPLLVKLARETGPRPLRKHKRYEIMWERENALPEVIANAWHDQGLMADLGDVNKALKKVMDVLHTWGSRKFGNVTRELARLRAKLAKLYEENADMQVIRNTLDDMNELLYREEMLWLQRSRIAWLKEGDRNTKFFHRKAVWRARKNRIMALKDHDGVVQDTPSEMERMATSYFQSVFTRDPSIQTSPVVGLFRGVILEDTNEELCKPFTVKEVSDVLFQIGPLKAPGPDGFPARFYQRNWDVLKDEIIQGVLKFFETGLMPDGVNETSIVLIPKVDHPME